MVVALERERNFVWQALAVTNMVGVIHLAAPLGRSYKDRNYEKSKKRKTKNSFGVAWTAETSNSRERNQVRLYGMFFWLVWF